VHIQRLRLQDHGTVANWSTVRRGLLSQARVTLVFQRADGQALHLRKVTRPGGQHPAIWWAVGIGTQPGGAEKLIY
jgi:3-polyprenyl-4-hydroxybenzoate decarboxylase